MAKALRKVVFDTGLQHLGAVYAKALLGAAEKVGKSELVVDELNSVVDDLLTKLPRLEAVLVAPRVALDVKTGMLDKALRGKVSEELLNFLKVLARHGRFNCIQAIQQAAGEQLNEMRGRLEVRLRSAEPLDQASLSLVTERLRAVLQRDIDLQVEVDSELIGGMLLRIGDTVYDGSVANRLVRLKDELLSKTGQQLRNNLDRFALAD